MKNKELYFDEFFRDNIEEFLSNPNYRRMNDYVCHGKYTLLDHSLRVTLLAYSIAKRRNRKVDYQSLIRGSMLHDYYLYDWHRKNEGHRLHGYRHPGFSLRNAKRDFPVNKKERNMILSHMFPLTLFPLPHSKEAWILTLADKVCAKKEHYNSK
jgi:uncharacterized protein